MTAINYPAKQRALSPLLRAVYDTKTSSAPIHGTDFHKFITLTAQSAVILFILIKFKAPSECKKDEAINFNFHSHPLSLSSPTANYATTIRRTPKINSFKWIWKS